MNTLKTIIATSLGLATGAAIGLLTAPRSGKRTRKLIKNEVNSQVLKLEEEAEKQVADLKESYSKGMKKYSETGKEVLEKAKQAVALN